MKRSEMGKNREWLVPDFVVVSNRCVVPPVLIPTIVVGTIGSDLAVIVVPPGMSVAPDVEISVMVKWVTAVIVVTGVVGCARLVLVGMSIIGVEHA